MKIVTSREWVTGRRQGWGRLLPIAAVAFLLCMAAVAGLAREVPSPRGYVNDYAGMISPGTEARLEQALQEFDRTDSTQIAILTIDSLEGDPLEDFSIRTVDAWGIGQQGKDNGILLLAVQKDRQVRIEVGRGLEGVVTDLAAGRIVDHLIVPSFRAGRYDQGFEAGVAALMQATRGEYQGGGRLGRQRRGEPPPGFTYLFFALALLGFLGSISRRLGMLGGAVLLPLLAFLGFGMPFGLLALLLLLPAGALGGLLLPLILAGLASGHGHGRYRGGGFGGPHGGFGGGGFGGSGFGGFGGGGFGGGGASGSW